MIELFEFMIFVLIDFQHIEYALSNIKFTPDSKKNIKFTQLLI